MQNIGQFQIQLSIFSHSFKGGSIFMIPYHSSICLSLTVQYYIHNRVIYIEMKSITHWSYDDQLDQLHQQRCGFQNHVHYECIRDTSQQYLENSTNYSHLFSIHCNFQEILQFASQLQRNSYSKRTICSKSKMNSWTWLPTLSNKSAITF